MVKIKKHACEENDEGKLICWAETDRGYCEIERVPDGEGGFKLGNIRGGDPEACKALERKVIQERT